MAMEALRIAAKESKFMKFILGGFIFLAVGGLVFTDVRGYFRGGLPNTTVARVGETELHIREFDQGLRGFLRQTGMSAPEAYQAGLINFYLSMRIDQILALQEAHDMNLVVDDAVIAKQIQSVFPNASKDEIQAGLRARGMSEAQMAQTLTQEIQRNIVDRAPDILGKQDLVSLKQALQRYEGERRSGFVYEFPAQKVTDKIEITDEDAQAAYEMTKRSQYFIPEKRRFYIGKMTEKDVQNALPNLSEEDLKAEYGLRESDFIVPEKRSLAQAVLSNPDQAQDVYEAAQKGMPLKNALQDVTGDSKGYRDVAAYDYKSLPEEIAQPSFEKIVTANTVLPPIKTLLGWHVVKVTEVSKERLKLFDEIKSDLKAELEQARLYDAVYDKIVETEELLDSGSDFADIKSKTSLKTVDTKEFSKTDTDAFPEDLKKALELSESVLDEIFNLPEGGASYPVEIDDNSYIVIGVQKIVPETFKPFENVKKEIKDRLKKQQVEAKAFVEVQKIAASLNDKTLSTKGIIKEFGAKKSRFSNVMRSDNKKYNVDLIFKTQKDQFAFDVSSGKVSIAFVDKISFDAKVKKEEEKTPMASIADGLFQAYLRSKTDVSINQPLLDAQYGPEKL